MFDQNHIFAIIDSSTVKKRSAANIALLPKVYSIKLYNNSI